MSLDVARPLLFVRALARVATNHDSVATTANLRWTSMARLLGEFVSLLALAYLAEHNAADRPYQILLGIFFAFFLPNLVLHDRALYGTARLLVGERAAHSVPAHLLAGALGVFLCFATYEGFALLLDDWRMNQKFF